MRSTPAEMARVALAVASVLSSSSVFDAVVREVGEASLAPRGYERPTTSSFQGVAERQGIPEQPGSAGLLVAEREFIGRHIDHAIVAAHPLGRLAVEARADLKCAVAWVHSFQGDPGALHDARSCTTQRVAAWVRRLKPVDKELDALSPPGARAVRSVGSSVALWAALV
jgi:hypothetical protein